MSMECQPETTFSRLLLDKIMLDACECWIPFSWNTPETPYPELAFELSSQFVSSLTVIFIISNLIQFIWKQASGMTVVADKLNFYRYISHFRAVHRGAFFTTMRTTEVRKLLPETWGEIFKLSTFV